MSLTTLLPQSHAWLRQWSVAARFTLLTRWLMAAAFIPSGLRKVAGQRFTSISSEVPIGSFFEAFFQAQEYYIFVGLAQVAAAALLLLPRTALIGALLYLPIISNIVVITWSLQFRGTVIVTAALLLANLYLLAWDAHRLGPLFSPRAQYAQPLEARRRLKLSQALAGAVLFGLLGGAVLIGLLQQPGAALGAALLVVGAVLLPLCLACVWEALALGLSRR